MAERRIMPLIDWRQINHYSSVSTVIEDVVENTFGTYDGNRLCEKGRWHEG